MKSGGDILEKASEAVKKEAMEEVGLNIDCVMHFTTSRNGATVEWDLYYFIAESYSELGSTQLEEGEDIKIEWVEVSRVLELIKNGDFAEDRSIGVLLRFLLSKQFI